MPEEDNISKPIFKSKPKSILNKNNENRPSISAKRYDEDQEENSILEKKSDNAVKKSILKSSRAYDNNPTTFNMTNTQNETNFDCTEIDFNLTQLNQTAMKQ